MGFGKLMRIHREFVIKPNPYITFEEAEKAKGRLVMAEVGVFTSLASFLLSVWRVAPSITQNSAFKKFTVFQLVIASGLYLSYLYELHRLSDRIPEG
jgi:hypothetical protein